MPDSDEEAEIQVFEAFGICACLWQICVVWAILNGKGVITIAPTGSGKSLTYWMSLLYIKHGITVVVTPLKLLRGQFVEMLQDNSISAVSIMASNVTNELFKVILLG
jgi:superfamily II DNA helicase RecQ